MRNIYKVFLSILLIACTFSINIFAGTDENEEARLEIYNHYFPVQPTPASAINRVMVYVQIPSGFSPSDFNLDTVAYPSSGHYCIGYFPTVSKLPWASYNGPVITSEEDILTLLDDTYFSSEAFKADGINYTIHNQNVDYNRISFTKLAYGYKAALSTSVTAFTGAVWHLDGVFDKFVYNVSDGFSYFPQREYVKVGTSIVIPEEPEIPEWDVDSIHFKQWIITDGKGNSIDFPADGKMPMSDLFFNGKWEVHDYDHGVVVAQPSETEVGSKLFTCQTCGHTYSETLPILDHDCSRTGNLTFHPETQADCTVDGNIAYYECICGKMYLNSDGTNEVTSVTIPASHKFKTEYSKDVSGHYHVCSIHSDVKTNKEVHTYDSGTVVTPSTETTKGSKKYTCAVCGYELFEEIPELTHEHDREGNLTHVDFMDSTCEIDGKVEHYLCVCGKKFSDSEATNELLSVIIPAAHKFKTEYSYDSSGHYHVCSVHSDVKSTIETHDLSEEVLIEPTEESKGQTKYTCSICSYSETLDTNKLLHLHTRSGNMTHVDFADSTCTTYGNVEYYLCKCNRMFLDALATEEIVTNLILPKEHQYNSIYLYNEYQHYQLCDSCNSATLNNGPHLFDENGECSICDYKQYEMIEGVDSIVYLSRKDNATFKSNADYSKFLYVSVDYVEVDPVNYLASEGSTVSELKASYLSTLSIGTHVLSIYSNDGFATCNFVIRSGILPGSPNIPKTGIE